MRSSSLRSALHRAVFAGGAAAALPVAALAATGAAAPAAAPSVWHVDIAKVGPQCVVDPGSIELWRADAAQPATVRIAGPANFPSATVEFAAGEAVVPLDPGAFPVADGSRMTVTDTTTGATLGTVDFAVLGSAPADPASLAEALKARGCTVQLERAAGRAAP